MLHSGLLFESENGSSRFWLTTEREVIVGRRPPWNWPNIRVPSILVAREHVRITAHEGGFLVEDAGSPGGLYLDHERICGPVPIGPGMRLQLCSDAIYTTRSLTAESLWDTLRDKPMPSAAALRMADQILHALLHLHENGHQHGDLSPHEILCTQDGDFVLLVRGWAETGPDAIRGNPTYTAPETITEDRIEPATDIYVLGLILFEALSGQRPFPSDNVHQHLASKIRGEPPTWPDGWAPSLRDWISAVMQIDPARRPSAREAIERLPGPRS